jgi:ElaB/YqjD/DUF883 family membrane-anchored ribosome-binding protein
MSAATTSGTQMDRSGSTRHPSLTDVKEDVTKLKDDVTKCAVDVAEVGRDMAKNGVAHTVETGKKLAKSAQESHEKVCTYISANPTTSVLIAAGVGALLARILPRG